MNILEFYTLPSLWGKWDNLSMQISLAVLAVLSSVLLPWVATQAFSATAKKAHEGLSLK